jgi:hypothetical protein
MKIANDLFLWCISNFLDKLNENKLADKLRKKISSEVDIKPKYAKEFDLYKAMKMYLKSNEKLQTYLEKLTEQLVGEVSDKEEEEIKEKKDKNDKKRKDSVHSNKNGKVELLGKKKRRSTIDSNDKLSFDKDFKVNKNSKVKEESDSEEEKKKPSKSKPEVKANGKKEDKSKVVDDDSDFDINPAKMREKYGIKVDESTINKPNAPFKRIKEEDYQIQDNKLTNNSWDYYAKTSGNTFGNEANNRLKHTAGKDFKKEKTKFKNKSGFGGGQLTTEVKSIKLNYDSDDD